MSDVVGAALVAFHAGFEACAILVIALLIALGGETRRQR